MIRSILRRGLGVAIPGLGAGIGAGLILARTLSSSFRGVDAFDPVVIAAAAVVLAVVAVAACLLPARQAARVDPSVALRAE